MRILCLAVLGWWLAGSGSRVPGPELFVQQPELIPYQVAGWLTSLEDEDEGRRFLLVDLGTERPAALPPQWTVVGSTGSSHATYYTFEKSCRFLCGDDESETCHYVAQLSLESTDIGRPLLALPGALAVSDVRTAVGEFDQPLPGPQWWGAEAAEPVWTHRPAMVNPVRFSYRVGSGEDGQPVLLITGGSQRVSFPLLDCSSRLQGGFTEVRCREVALLAREGLPLLVSMADYNVPAAEIAAAVTLAGRPFHLIRLGLKAQTIYGLLGAEGQALFRPRDYPSIC